MLQVRNPPPNPAKDTDSRFAAYAREFGNESWELDALSPAILAELVEQEVETEVNETVWAEDQETIRRGRAELSAVGHQWSSVVEGLKL